MTKKRRLYEMQSGGLSELETLVNNFEAGLLKPLRTPDAAFVTGEYVSTIKSTSYSVSQVRLLQMNITQYTAIIEVEEVFTPDQKEEQTH